MDGHGETSIPPYNFVARGIKICTKQGVTLKIRWGNGSPEGLDWSLKKFIFRYQYLVEIYSVSAEKIISDAFSYSENV
jgi:hypothetical protein